MSKVSGSHFTEAFHMLMRNRPMSSWQRDKKGSTPLHLAVISDNYEAARVLISRSDTKRARLVADDNSYKPSDLASHE
jgi:ankyrin repeat protein